METFLHIRWQIQLENVDVWFQDEARFGQQNTTTRVWARKGTRPRVVQQQQFEYAYLFGAVFPSSGATEALISPVVNRSFIFNRYQKQRQKVDMLLWCGLAY